MKMNSVEAEKDELMKVVKSVLPETSIEVNLGKDENSYTIDIISKSKELEYRIIVIYILNNYLISLKSGKFVGRFHSEKIIRAREKLYFSEKSLKEMLKFLNE